MVIWIWYKSRCINVYQHPVVPELNIHLKFPFSFPSISSPKWCGTFNYLIDSIQVWNCIIMAHLLDNSSGICLLVDNWSQIVWLGGLMCPIGDCVLIFLPTLRHTSVPNQLSCSLGRLGVLFIADKNVMTNSTNHRDI